MAYSGVAHSPPQQRQKRFCKDMDETVSNYATPKRHTSNASKLQNNITTNITNNEHANYSQNNLTAVKYCILEVIFN